jgi:serine phosphatase RsbU (regulator of sigma subunit)
LGIAQSLDSKKLQELDHLYDQTWDLIVEYPDSCVELSYLLLNKANSLGSKRHSAFAYSCMAEAFVVIGEFRQAIETHRKALDLFKEINDLQGMSATYGNIGNLYYLLQEYESAKRFMTRGYEIETSNQDTIGLAYTLANLGIIEKYLENYAKSLSHYKEALTYVLDNDEHISLRANLLGNIGSLYITTGEYDLAYPYLTRSMELKILHKDELSLSPVYSNLGEYYESKDNYTKALHYFNQAFSIAEKYQGIPELISSTGHLYRMYKRGGDYELAVKFLERHIQLKAERDKDENTRALARMEIDYEYTVKATADSLRLVKEQAVLDADKKAVQERSLFLTIAGVLGLIFILIVINRYRVISEKNKIISEQKNHVELQRDLIADKNKEIMDSITYARRIQQAILPAKHNMDKVLQDYFVLYLPKDVVAGDFYWLEQKDDRLLAAVADCTGHGVPGAMVSVICNNGLNRSVREHGKVIPGEILDQTREIVLQEFEKSNEDVKDGMDISLVSLQQAHRAEKQNENENENEYSGRSRSHSRTVLHWSGANNPLWIIRNKPEENPELLEIKPNKQPIGKFDAPEPFSTHEIELSKGDVIYLFTDGLQDQFGGDKGKKLKPARLKEWLLASVHHTMETQKEEIMKRLEDWMGEYEQLDDICIIGIRV